MAKTNSFIEKQSFDKWCESEGIKVGGQTAGELWPAWLARAKVGDNVLDTVSKFEKRVGDTLALDQEIIAKLDGWLHKKEVFDAIKNLPASEAFVAGELVGLCLRRRDQARSSDGLRRPVV